MTKDENRSFYNLDVALGMVRDRLATVDLEKQCRNCDAICSAEDTGTTVTLTYLNRPYVITFPDLAVSPRDGSEELSLRERILVLRYLAQAKGTPPTKSLVTYRDLPGGIVYFPTFSKRTTDQLARRFGNEPESLLEAARPLGGYEINLGDAGVVIRGFSRVPVNLVLWRGDQEFPAEARLLFDANVTDYLESEDVTVLCETITWKLARYRG